MVRNNMPIIRLNWRAEQTLKEIARSGPKAREVRRAQVLLWLHQGDRAATVANQLGLSRMAVYKIVDRYQERTHLPVRERVQDWPRPGRPGALREQTKAVLVELLAKSPQEYGYRAQVWSVPLFQRHAEHCLQIEVSTQTVRRALHELRYRYKRPRYVLARRAPNWRQAKGG